MNEHKFPALLWRSIPKGVEFVRADIWRIRENNLPRGKSFLIRFLKVIILTFRGVAEDRTPLQASALTFYSLLSVVPVLAMVFGIAKGFGFEKALEKLIISNLEGQEQVAIRIVGFAHALLENVKGGLIAGIGLAFLLYTVIKILSHIENALNDIWGIKKGRRVGRKVVDYLSIMVIGPILFLISSTMTVMITSSVRLVIEKVPVLGVLSPAIFFSLSLLPYVAVWTLFSFVYIFVPNTKVNFRSGILGGVIAGTMYQIFQWGYINVQIGVSKYNAIYGSFAALPLFFMWLQISWLIVLFGAEISFAHQNVETYEFEQDCLNVSPWFKKLLSLRIVHLMIKNFSSGKQPLDAHGISHELEIPIRLVNQILFELTAAGVVSEVSTEGGKGARYQPGRDPETITIKYVIDALEKHGSANIPVAQSGELKKLAESLEAFSNMIEQSNANRKLKEI